MADPRLAIIIPAYRQPGLLVEAIHTALAQRAGFGLAVVVVNDGCPMAETHAIGTAFALADRRVTYLRKPNGGLSSARNAGVAHALAAWPGLRALYFLDADNRLTPTAMASAMAVLEQGGADWVYPSIDKFGIAWSGNYAAPYSRLAHVTFDNLCEAGSLVARHVFDAGLRFDETMKDGFEDWDFWLQAIARGFVGRNDPGLGLEYRQRAESMVAGSNRRRARILAELRARHEALFAPRQLLAWEHAEAPRFLLADAGSGKLRGFSDPEAPPHHWSWAEWGDAFQAEAAEPETFGTPPFALSLGSGAESELRRLKLWPGLLWLAERLATRHRLVALHARPEAGRLGVTIALPGQPAPAGAPFGHAMRQATLREAAARGEEIPARDMAHLVITAPFTGPLPADPGLPALLAAARSPTRDKPRRWFWRSSAYMPQRRQLHVHLQKALGAAPLLPRGPSPTGRPQIGFALPIVAFGGVERVAIALAGVLRAAGCDTHLVLVGPPEAELAEQLVAHFDSIALLADPAIPLVGGPQRFFGHDLSTAADLPRAAPGLLGLFAGLDAVILSHTATLAAMLGQLRELGIRTIAHLHVLDRSPLGREVGHPALALAFEHACDLLMPCSETLADWLHGMGVPREKLVVLPNAPPRPMAGALVAEHLARRAGREGGPLRVLFLGRLDRQKGIERLIELARQAQPLGLAWRIIGGEVISEAGSGGWAAEFAALGLAVEPPLHEDAALAEALTWADVLLLPSRWEGAPLTILEAQRLGCVPLATRLGAVHELVRDGQDGLLVADGPDGAVAAAMLAALESLAEDRDRLRRLSMAAAERAAGRDWARHAAPLLERLRRWFPDMGAG